MAFRSILFVHLGEGDDAGLRSALALARRVGARLTLAGAAEQPSLELLHASGLPFERLERIVLESEGDALAALRASAGDAALSVRALRGAPVAAVIGEVREAGHDLVMVSAPPAVGMVERFVPSTARQLLRRCPCPVWLSRPVPDGGIRRVGAAVDADAEGERHGLDRSILDAAFAVAGACAARVDVLHALTLHPSEAMLRGRGGMSDAEVAALVARIRARAETTMRALVAAAAPPPGVAVAQHVLRGTPGPAIAEYAQQAALDLLVIGTLGRTGIAGLVIGNTAEEILQRAECSILALKPPGFAAAE